jgi:MFS family permease
MLFTFNLVYALVSGPAGILSDRVGRRKLIVAAWVAYAVIYVGLALASSAWQVWVLFAMYGAYYGASEGNSKALVADLVPPQKRGIAYGLFNSAIGLAALPASIIAGVLWQGLGNWMGLGPSAPFYLGALLSLVAAILLVKEDF